jgi:hypothetical protein
MYVVTQNNLVDNNPFTWARKCPVCGRLITVMRNGVFMIHGPKKARCMGSHERYDEAARVPGSKPAAEGRDSSDLWDFPNVVYDPNSASG